MILIDFSNRLYVSFIVTLANVKELPADKAIALLLYQGSQIGYHSFKHGIIIITPLQWRYNELDGVSNHRHLHCLLNCWFRRRPKKTLKLRLAGLCAGNSPVTGEFFAQKASNAEIFPFDDVIMPRESGHLNRFHSYNCSSEIIIENIRHFIWMINDIIIIT